jgi:ABC-type multidrug transport system fused ATPase/permease subunit
MFKVIRKLFSLITPYQRKRFYKLQILVVIMSFMEIIGVTSIIPFMALVGDPSQLKQDTIIAKAYLSSGIASEQEFLFLLGLFVLGMLFVSSVISMLTIWRLAIFGSRIGIELADTLYIHYLKQDWLFHSAGSSAQLTKKVSQEALRVSRGLVMPLMSINSRFLFIIFMSSSILFYDPGVAIVGLSIFVFAYLVLYKFVRQRLHNNGIAISEAHEDRFRLMNEGFGGIKDVLLLGRDNDFINRFTKSGKAFASSQGSTETLVHVPRYLMELIAFGSMITLLLYLIVNHEGDLGMILPIISVYALATFKLMPALQQIYMNIGNIKANISAFESIQLDLENSIKADLKASTPKNGFLYPAEKISLENITFTYPGKVEPALEKINISISAKNIIGIVGPSGAGKSTLIDIMLGLLIPQQGNLKVDDSIITSENNRLWQNSIGYVAQSIFLSEGTIVQNVAFGIPEEHVDLDKVKSALKLACLNEFIESLDEGIYTRVGERGVQLSGGQRQRVGIARALYHQAEVLIFDEATSSLDGITEKMIMESIDQLSGKKTIIMIAHRLKTIKNCDKIFFLANGRVIDEGSYQELISKNDQFKKMALHA